MSSFCPYTVASTQLFDSPISTAAPLGMFTKVQNKLPRVSFDTVGADVPVSTNKFYSNLFLGKRNMGVWTIPYMLWVPRDPATASNFGASISHATEDKRVFGDNPNDNPIRFYINALGINSVTFGAQEFSFSRSTTTLSNPTHVSVELNLHADVSQYGLDTKRLQMPLYQGMGFITGRYKDLTPKLTTGVLFRKFEELQSPRSGLQKWRITEEDNSIWLLYAYSETGTRLNLSLRSNSEISASSSFTGFLQISKLSKDGTQNAGLEGVIDSTAGAFPIGMEISGVAEGTVGTYHFKWTRYGSNNANGLLTYALKHHLDSEVTAMRTGLQLNSPTKGNSEALIGDSWTLVEPSMPTGTGFFWGTPFTAAQIAVIKPILEQELAQDMGGQTYLNSMYFSGKGFQKFAQLLIVAARIGQQDLARRGLERLKSAFQPFLTNKQQFPLVYDLTWRGVISGAMFTNGDAMSDFGNGYYNDHHFHWSYFLFTGAAIAQLDKELNNNQAWLQTNRPWFETLLRDMANPSSSDPWYPVSRAFDWYNGHSWAKGLFESADGKDQESTSEDMNCGYAIKLWGNVVGDAKIEGRGNLMMALMKRSFNEYFLLKAGNKAHPWNFIANKVTGILFENKVDHSTYFGANIEYIQGIHMIPLTPASAYYRDAQFCREEWDQWFSNRTAGINDGWKGILYANVALFQPQSSWLFFAQEGFKNEWLDGGASRSWYLAQAAGKWL
ncbi:glycoside hydrolase [Morchella conica CCBAS932]|uniref:glucan endo-1,3-beta-D-glucosidase n=1 Tax=Morchella conica CCBAS932 TaxID=1392247 RepID=A0A3N4L0V1_9PEZI|nr:glycoside hydrolase [Morchella conica CCBAS932]